MGLEQKNIDFDTEATYISPEIMNSPYGYKLILSVFNNVAPQYYREIVLETAKIFRKEYLALYGEELVARDIYVDGQLSVCLNDKLTWNKKYRLQIVIYLKRDPDVDSQDYVVEIPISPLDVHFREFRQCFRNVFEMMFEGGKGI